MQEMEEELPDTKMVTARSPTFHEMTVMKPVMKLVMKPVMKL